MLNRTVTLVDIGLDASFKASMSFVQSALDNINAGYEEPVVDVNYVRSRDEQTIWSGLTTHSTVLHVMAHGTGSDDPAFISSDRSTEMTLADLAHNHVESGVGIAAPIVIADGCRTGTGVWQRALRSCLKGPVAYIGTRTAVGWSEGTIFGAAFYGALLQKRGKGVSAMDQGMEAAARAAKAFTLITASPCPYVAVRLQPPLRGGRGERG